MYEAFKDRELREVITSIKSGKDVSYKVSVETRSVEYFIDGMPISSKNIERLKEAGIVEEEAGGSYLACPFDGSTDLRVLLFCPVHNKPVAKQEIYEDRSSGRLVSYEEARGKEGMTRLYWFRCAEGEIVSSPRLVFRCEKGHTFDLSEAITVQAKGFRIRKEALEALEDYEAFINGVAEEFSGRGQKVTAPAVVNGASGAAYELDALIEDGEKRVGVLLKEMYKASFEDIISLLPQVYDLSLALSRLILIIIPQIPAELTGAFEKGNTKVVTGNRLSDIQRAIVSAILAKEPPASAFHS